MKQVIIFASGGGSNAKAIYNYALQSKAFAVAAICSDKEQPGVRTWAETTNIPFHHIPARLMDHSDTISILQKYQPSLIILAGYLRLVPIGFIEAFRGMVVNIHPSLLPAFGGKGMYGHHVHEAVVAQKEWETGLTIHWVNEHYDKGKYIKQIHVPVFENDSADAVAARVLAEEHYWYPRTIATLLEQ